MRLLTRDKRAIIECLLIAGEDVFCTVSQAAEHAGLSWRLLNTSVALRLRAHDRALDYYTGHMSWLRDQCSYNSSCLMAAYDLIESSATLRREFFGK